MFCYICRDSSHEFCPGDLSVGVTKLSALSSQPLQPLLYLLPVHDLTASKVSRYRRLVEVEVSRLFLPVIPKSSLVRYWQMRSTKLTRRRDRQILLTSEFIL